jgi:hypothetical protein
MMSQWWYSGLTVMSQWCHSGVTVVLQLCKGVIELPAVHRSLFAFLLSSLAQL